VRARLAIVAVITATVLALPGVAYAASSSAAPSTYDLAFTLPTAGKSGCQVCHGDPGLQQATGETTSSLYVDQQVLDDSAHPEAVCTGCHADFALKTPHENVKNGYDWRNVASTSCQTCKDHQPQYDEYTSGAHSPVPEPGETAQQTAARRAAAGQPAEVPTCGLCHGGHAVPSKEDTAAQFAYQRRGLEVCGGCHAAEADTYADYYHGAAYREGAWDAPACWDCHGAHTVLPATDRQSPVNPDNLVQTCGQEGCHPEVTPDFVEYAQLIHGKPEELQANPLWSFYDSAKQGISAALEKITALFQ